MLLKPRTLLPFVFAAAALVAQSTPLVRTHDGKAPSTKPFELQLPELLTTKRYSVLATLPELAAVGDRMLRVELFDPTGMPTGKVLHAGDPDMHFVFRPRIAGTSVLRIARTTSRAAISKTIADPARATTRDDSVVALQQDGAELADALREGDGDARLVDGGAYSGKSALVVRKAIGRSATNVSGWAFKITENPVPGEYRYLRFAWKLEGAPTAMLQFANSGVFGLPTESKHRYRAGAAIEGWAATSLAANRFRQVKNSFAVTVEPHIFYIFIGYLTAQYFFRQVTQFHNILGVQFAFKSFNLFIIKRPFFNGLANDGISRVFIAAFNHHFGHI